MVLVGFLKGSVCWSLLFSRLSGWFWFSMVSSFLCLCFYLFVAFVYFPSFLVGWGIVGFVGFCLFWGGGFCEDSG